MKRFFVLLLVFSTLLFVSCSSGRSSGGTDILPDADGEDNDSETQNDTDTTPDDQNTDDTDTIPEENSDADSSSLDNDADASVEPTEEEKCIEAGGTWVNDSACVKMVECEDKPENTEWNGDPSYVSARYTDGVWGESHKIETQYSEEEGICHYKCAAGCFRDGSSCKKTIPLGRICTGQTKCYDYGNTGEIECPTEGNALFGQDAQYTDKCAARDLTIENIAEQNVVFDHNTGLMWQQTVSEAGYSWEDAFSYCSDLSYAGFDDWRLPSPSEFLTIVDSGRFDPPFDAEIFPEFTGLAADYEFLWTSAKFVGENDGDDEERAFFISIYFGSSTHTELFTTTDELRVMCVRGAEFPKSSLTTSTINDDIIVKDSATGLVWTPFERNEKNWKEALSYCEELVYAGISDWRLPNRNELASLLNNSKFGPASDFSIGDLLDWGAFWTSTSFQYNEENYEAWYVDLEDGDVDYCFKSIANYTLCVSND